MRSHQRPCVIWRHGGLRSKGHVRDRAKVTSWFNCSSQARGVWIGKVWKSDEHMLYDDGWIVKARGVALLLIEESWSKEAIENVKATNWNFTPSGVVEAIAIPAE